MLNPLRDFIAFDLETTGLERDADEIIEIGAVRVRDGQLEERFSCLLKAEKPLNAMIESLTGISPAMLAESGQDPKLSIEAFLRFVGDLPLVAHNSDFDVAFIANAITKFSLAPLSNPVYDSLLLARIAWPGMDNHRLENLVDKLEIPVQKAHRALPDAEQAAQLWIMGQVKLASYSSRTLARLSRVLESGPAQWRALFTSSVEAGEDTVALPVLAPALSQPEAINTPVEELFAPGQAIDAAFKSLGRTYQSRPRQIRMASLVERSFKESRVLAVESEPGTGRMLACIVAAVRHGISRRRPVYFAVSNRQRMESIIATELPVMQALYGKELRLAMLKPPSAYLSPRKFSAIMDHPETRLFAEEKLAILPLITWLETTLDGDINKNMGFNQDRNKLLWSKLSSESYLGEPGGHAHAAREKALRAHLVLIDQALFMDDLAMEFSILPPYDAIVFDEAHYLPEIGQVRLGREVSFFRLKYIIQLLAFSKTSSAGLLAEMERQATESVAGPETLETLEKLKEKIFEPERQLQKFFNKLAKHAQKRRKDGENRIRYADKLVIEFGSGPEPVTASVEELEGLLIKLADAFPDLAADIRKVSDLLRAFRADLEHLSHPQAIAAETEEPFAESSEVYWIEDFPNPHRAHIRCAPMDIGPWLAKKFLPQMDSVVFASPALTLGDQFGFFAEQLGLDLQSDRVKTALVRSKDKEDKPVPVFIARFSPVLNNTASADSMGALILRGLLEIVHPAFVFFTHVGMLKQIRGILQEGLSAKGRMVLAQHIDGSRENLLHLFRRRKDTCLLGTETFMANLGAEDQIPEIIMVTKLPFPVPTEPITAAHLDKLTAAKGNPLYDYLLPWSILRLKQELNRLPHRPGRPQIIWILDPRPITEKYGKMYLRGLGRDVIVCETEQELLSKTREALGKFAG